MQDGGGTDPPEYGPPRAAHLGLLFEGALLATMAPGHPRTFSVYVCLWFFSGREGPPLYSLDSQQGV